MSVCFALWLVGYATKPLNMKCPGGFCRKDVSTGAAVWFNALSQFISNLNVSCKELITVQHPTHNIQLPPPPPIPLPLVAERSGLYHGHPLFGRLLVRAGMGLWKREEGCVDGNVHYPCQSAAVGTERKVSPTGSSRWRAKQEAHVTLLLRCKGRNINVPGQNWKMENSVEETFAVFCQ